MTKMCHLKLHYTKGFYSREIETKNIPKINRQHTLTISTMQVAIKLFLYSTSHKWLRVLLVPPAFLKPNDLRRVTEVNAQAGKTLKHEA